MLTLNFPTVVTFPTILRTGLTFYGTCHLQKALWKECQVHEEVRDTRAYQAFLLSSVPFRAAVDGDGALRDLEMELIFSNGALSREHRG